MVCKETEVAKEVLWNQAIGGTYNSGSMVRNACPESCGLCKTEVLAPTGAPSLSNWPTSNPTGMPTHAPVSEEDRARSIEMCEDSTIFRWNDDDTKTCDWIGNNDIRRESLCENSHFLSSGV